MLTTGNFVIAICIMWCMIFSLSFQQAIATDDEKSQIKFIPKGLTTLIGCYDEEKVKEVRLNLTKSVTLFTIDGKSELQSRHVKSYSLAMKDFPAYSNPTPDKCLNLNYNEGDNTLPTANDEGYISYTVTVAQTGSPDNTTCAFRMLGFDDFDEFMKFLKNCKSDFPSAIYETCFKVNHPMTMNYSLPMSESIFFGGNVKINNIFSVYVRASGSIAEYNSTGLNEAYCSSSVVNHCTVPIVTERNSSFNEVCVLVKTEENLKIKVNVIAKHKTTITEYDEIAIGISIPVILLLIMIIITTICTKYWCNKKAKHPTEEEGPKYGTIRYTTTAKTEEDQDNGEREIVVREKEKL